MAFHSMMLFKSMIVENKVSQHFPAPLDKQVLPRIFPLTLTRVIPVTARVYKHLIRAG